MTYLNKFAQRAKATVDLGNGLVQTSGESPVCLFDGLFHEFFVLNGKWRWDGDGESHQRAAGEGCSDLLYGVGWNQSSLLPAAQFQKRLAIF